MILKLPHRTLETRVLGFWPRARLSFLVNPRLIGVSAHRLAGLAICEDFVRKNYEFNKETE